MHSKKVFGPVIRSAVARSIGSIDGQNPAERADRVRFSGRDERRFQILPESAAARVRVLNDRGGGLLRELLDQLQRAVEVVEVVEADLFTARISANRVADARLGGRRATIERRFLVRVLSVAQVLLFLKLQPEGLRQGRVLDKLALEEISDGGVIARGVGIRLGHQAVGGG